MAQAWPSAETDVNVLGKYCVLANFFSAPDGSDVVDGIRGYTHYERLCGLRCRRQGRWDAEPLGQASPYVVEFVLQPGERFASIYVSAKKQFGTGGALAVSDAAGGERRGPWLTRPSSSVPRMAAAVPGSAVR